MEENIKFIINSKLEVSWNDGYYKSNIEDVNKQLISISIPIKEGQYIPLRIGEMIEVIYYFENDIYKFYTKVVNRKIDGIPVIEIEYPDKVFKIQRRKFVRVPIVCNVVYSKIGAKQENGNIVKLSPDKVKDFKGIMVDLSGGGMRIKLKEKLNLGDIISVDMPLGEDTLKVKGEIVRVEYDEINKLHVCGMDFKDLEERAREKLIRYIFQIMRDRMRKGIEK